MNKYLVILLLFSVSIVGFSQSTKIRLFTQTTGFDSIVAKNDTMFFYASDSVHRAYVPDMDSTNEIIDSTSFNNNILQIFQGEDTAIVDISSVSDADWYKIGTTDEPKNIDDSIFTGGDIQLTNYLESRADDTSTYLNTLFTDAVGNVKSGRREIIPAGLVLDVSTTSTNNIVNYYNHYSTQMVNVGLPTIPLVNLDFYVLYFDAAIFANVSISSLGVLEYDIIATDRDHAVIDVRFYTK